MPSFSERGLSLYETIFPRTRAAYHIRKALEGCTSVLDLGCGEDSPVKDAWWVKESLGVDAYPESIEKSREKGVHTDYLVGDVLEMDFPEGSFDAVMALDLLEHIEKDKGTTLLSRMERFASKKVIVSTPNGWVPQDDIGGNPLQRHRAAWEVDDFTARGYRVIGLHGLKGLRETETHLRWRPKVFWKPISDISQIIVKGKPRLAYHLFAVKEVDSETGSRRRPVDVLISPAHYLLDESQYGSEYTWVASILKGLSKSGEFFLHIITGSLKSFEADTRNFCIYEIAPRTEHGEGLLQRLVFTLRKTIKSKALGRKHDIKIIHHMMPYWIGITFDLDFVLKKKGKVYVLGPIQSPHMDTLSDSVAGPIDRSLYAIFNKASEYLSGLTLRNADKIITINSNARELLITRGIKEEKIETITPGIDTDKFKKVPFEKKNQERIVFITVGHLVKRKATDLVLRAIGEVAKYHEDIELRIIGDGPELQGLKGLVGDLGLEDVVRFCGSIPHREVNRQYEQAHVFVGMSRAESWGQVYLEAMASGLPVVTSENIGSQEIVKEGVFGFLIDQEDYMMLAEKLKFLLDNRNLIEEYGERAREEAETRYDWEQVIVPRYIELYESLIVTA